MARNQNDQFQPRKSSASGVSFQLSHTYSRSAIVTVFLISILGATILGAEAFSLPCWSVRKLCVDGRQAMPLSAVLKSTLNDDGDFCIEGINDDKTNASSGGEEFSSLLDMEYNQAKNSKLSDIMTPSSPLPSNDDIRFETIQLDGDDSSIASGGSSVLDPFPFLQAATQAVSPMTGSTTAAATPAIQAPPTVQPPLESTKLDSEEQALVEALEVFLDSIFQGQVVSKDIGKYAIELMSIGFDPDCEWSQELQLDDLCFMKKLHQRYFWKEWEKLL